MSSSLILGSVEGLGTGTNIARDGAFKVAG